MVKRGKNKNQNPPKKQSQGKTNKKGIKGIKPSKVFIYALALAALGGGGYLVYDRMKRRKTQQLPEEDQDTIVINNNLPASYANVSSAIRTSGLSASDSFPLKRGSRGTRVKMLQQSLSKTTPSILTDGIFGSQTAAALKAAGYPEIIDEATFNKITGASGGSTMTVVFNPADIALKLYKAAQNKNLDSVLTQLKQIKSVSEYSSVNEYYKRQGFISKTIVTDLLDYAFKGNEAAKQQVRNEFLRIGLKMDESGRWSLPTGQAGLQGIPLYKDLITLRETIVIDSQNNRIPVRRNTILGDEVRVQNGMTWFRSIDHNILKVPTQDVKYT